MNGLVVAREIRRITSRLGVCDSFRRDTGGSYSCCSRCAQTELAHWAQQAAQLLDPAPRCVPPPAVDWGGDVPPAAASAEGRGEG
jgi:hypothetical protein